MEDKPKCKQCQLFDSQNKICGVIVLNSGEKIHLPVDAEDDCFFKQEFRSINKEQSNIERFQVDVQQVKIWVEDEHGNKCAQGKVMIERPTDYFGDLDLEKTGKN